MTWYLDRDETYPEQPIRIDTQYDEAFINVDTTPEALFDLADDPSNSITAERAWSERPPIDDEEREDAATIVITCELDDVGLVLESLSPYTEVPDE